MSTREIAAADFWQPAATAWLYFGGVMPQIGPAACLIAGAASAIPLLRRANVKTAVLLYFVTSVLGLLLTPRKLIAAAYVLLFGLYPIVKYLIECRLPVFTQLSGKLAYFNIVLVLAAVSGKLHVCFRRCRCRVFSGLPDCGSRQISALLYMISGCQR